MRQISLDTETTGRDPDKGDRLVEIGVRILKAKPSRLRFLQRPAVRQQAGFLSRAELNADYVV